MPQSCAIKNRKSQFGEDLLLLPLLLNLTANRPGTFVEIGAWDGISLSNTFVLERCYNWTGALIEGNPKNFLALKRSARTARKAHWAVCDKKRGTVRITRDGLAVAGQIGAMSPAYIATHRIGDNITDTVNVRCKRFDRILAGLRIPRANFLSLDMEGAELEVLSTVDTSIFDVILVEMDGFNASKDAAAHRLILDSGLQHCLNFRPYLSRVYARRCTL